MFASFLQAVTTQKINPDISAMNAGFVKTARTEMII